MKKEQLVYYPETDFNGVLIVLREPHTEDAETDKAAFVGNQTWFKSITSDAKLDHKASAYRNRFKEMLSICGEQKLSSCAFTNIKSTGGSETASKEYWKMDKAPIINDILETVKPKFVFVLWEIFDEISKSTTIQDGITYSGDKTKRKTERDGIVFFEIYHPSYRRKIVVDK